MEINRAVFQSDWVGRIIDGKFSLLEWLGSSESGAVFRTELQGAQPQRAAIRLIAATDEKALSMLDGWKAAASLSHPHLMRLFHYGRCRVGQDEVLYAVTEYAEEKLSQVLPERPLSPAEVSEMLSPLLDALSYVHAKGLAYGRLKPSKVLVVKDEMKLPVDTLHRTSKTLAPPAQLQVYDAPERAAGSISAASDAWSLGVLLIEALTQRPPLWDGSANSDPAIPRSVPQPFADITQKCLHREPNRRCSLEEIQRILDPTRPPAVKETKVDVAVRPKQTALPVEVVDGATSRRRVALLIAGVIVLCIVVAALLLHKTHPETTVETSPAAVVPAPTQAPVTPVPSAKDATAKGEVAERVMPDISEAANRTIHGKFEVRVRVSVDSNGDVSNAAFESRGPSRYFSNQAIEAARKWKFKAAQLDGRPVASEWSLRFEFRRDKTDCDPVEVKP